MASNFQDILSKKATEIEKPIPAPIGHYLCANPKVPDFKNIGENETPAAEFTFHLISPGDDVDPDDFQDWGGQEKLKGKTVRYLMWLSDDALFRAKEQLAEAFDIDPEGKDLGEMFAETAGTNVMVEIGHRPSKDGEDLYMDVKSLAAA